MSVSVQVQFGREGRVYEVGEPVRGRVLVETDRSAECLGVSLIPTWRTHGLGSIDWQLAPEVYTIHDGPLPDRPSHEIPFEFPAPLDPLTYHGWQFEVEHYVQVEVALPASGVSLREAAEASVSEKYTVLPGPLMEPPPRALLRETAWAFAARNYSWVSPVASSGTDSPHDLQAVHFGLETMGNLRRWAAERRIGPVVAHLNGRVVNPGDTLKVNLRLKPPSPVMINGASVQLRGQEISTSRYTESGSALGRQRTISEHALHSETRPITRHVSLQPLESAVFHGEVKIPDTSAFTFLSDHHKVVWEAVVRIDIPTWPDWERPFPLVVWPEVSDGLPEEDLEPVVAGVPEELPEGVWEAATRETPGEVLREISELARKEDRGEAEPSPEEQLSWDEAREVASNLGILGGEEGITERDGKSEPLVSQIRSLWEESEAGGTGVGAEQPAPMPPEDEVLLPHTEPVPQPGSGQALEEAVLAIRGERIFGGDRDRLIKDLTGQRFSFVITVKRADRTLGMYSELDYKDGRTVTGTVVGTDIEVSVLYPNALNEEVDSFQLGADFPVEGVVSDWDSLRKQPKIRVQPT